MVYDGATYQVTGIGDAAFASCTNLTSVSIPKSIVSIGECAFAYCSSLSSISIPDQVTLVGGRAFYGTLWYNSQPDGLLYLDNWLIGYKGNKPTGELNIAERTKGIAAVAFSGCSDLTSVTIPNSVTSIGNSAFSSCSGLTSVTIPNSVETIGNSAFSGCTGLTSVELHTKTICEGETIGKYAFDGCTSIETLTIGSEVESIKTVTYYTTVGSYEKGVFDQSNIQRVNISDLSKWCKMTLNRHLYEKTVKDEDGTWK